MNQCRTCSAYDEIDELYGRCQAKPPILLTHLLAKDYDDSDLLGATAYPVIHKDDSQCREYVLADALRGV
jgi:hypothetical protein